MKIKVNQIPLEGLILEEEINPAALDLATDIVKFREPLKVKGEVTRITNAVTIRLDLSGKMYLECSRCIGEFSVELKKKLQFNYPVEKTDLVIDLGPEIRQEIIVDYPMKPLCKTDCRGLCPKCGKNLNEGGCSCAITQKKTF